MIIVIKQVLRKIATRFKYSPLDPIFFSPNYFPRCCCRWCWPLLVANVPVRHEPMSDYPISMAFDLVVQNLFRMLPTFWCHRWRCSSFYFYQNEEMRRLTISISTVLFASFHTQLDWAQMNKIVNGVVMKNINFNWTNRLPLVYRVVAIY